MTVVTVRRNKWRALAMSLLLPGFGQLYNGEINKAIWLYLAFLLLTGPGVAAIALYLPGGLMMPVLVLGVLSSLTLWVWGAVNGWRAARTRVDYVPAAWQVSGTYALVLLVCGMVVPPLMMHSIRTHGLQSFDIASASMEPTLWRHDLIFADKRYNCPGCKSVQRGDIAIFTYPNDRTQIYVKRIIGLPGDVITIAGRGVSVNGRSLETEAGTEGIDGRTWQVIWGDRPTAEMSATVPAGAVFVLGDNRSNSADSRQFGPVPLDDVAGNVRQIWGSFGDDGIRWERLGMVPR
jgi:signal peptidase I